MPIADFAVLQYTKISTYLFRIIAYVSQEPTCTWLRQLEAHHQTQRALPLDHIVGLNSLSRSDWLSPYSKFVAMPPSKPRTSFFANRPIWTAGWLLDVAMWQ